MEDKPFLLQRSVIADDPETEIDYFNRKPFAQQISDTIISRKEPSSIVIGIYGKWGEGKTTVLNFIEKELKEHSNIICIRYNPWYYSDEVTLLQDFFDVLADKLEKVSSDNLKAQVKKYGKHVSRFATSKSATINIGLLQFNPFSSDSFLDLTESKKEIQNNLKRQNVRVVVLMDDIDRLDKIEIQSIFKLVKLSADFHYLDYILAFDEEMVASAIAEKYGSSGIESGRNFLEKVINVPLHLPLASETALFNFLRNGIDNNVLPIIKQKLKEEEHILFFEQFRKGLQIRLKTPRMAKRYQNALIFAIPTLEGEVNIVDLMLIEGIRVFYPQMYSLIKDNPKTLINILLLEKELNKSFEKIKTEIEVLPPQEQDSFQDLIAFLFPNSQQFFDNLHYSYPVENQRTLTRKKRIASLRYFNRYFSYAVPKGDISDLEIDQFVEDINSNDQDNWDVSSQIIEQTINWTTSQILKLIDDNDGSGDSFISKIHRIKKELNSKASQKLALAMSKLSDDSRRDKFPEGSDLYLITDLLQTMLPATRYACSKEMLRLADSICFALNIYYIAERKEMQLSAENIEDLKLTIMNRISNEMISENEPIYVKYLCGGLILRFLHDYNFKDLSKYIEETFSSDPNNSLRFLKCFYMKNYSSRGVSKSFGIENYNTIKELINPEFLYNTLHNIYADILDKPTYVDEDNEDIMFLQSFSKIYHQRKQENVK